MNQGTALMTSDDRLFFVTSEEHAGSGSLPAGTNFTNVSDASAPALTVVSKAGDGVDEVVLIESGSESGDIDDGITARTAPPAGVRVLLKAG